MRTVESPLARPPLRRRRWLTALTALVLAAPAVAQQRRPLLGRVVDAAGEPVAAATVHCAFVPVGAANGRALDHATAETDARGRFRFDARPCTPHRLWAIGPAREGAARLVSEVQVASSGELVEVRCGREQAATALTVKGLDAWAERGPFRLRFVPAAAELEDMVLPIGDDGVVAVPPLPSTRVYADVLDRDGEVLYGRSIAVQRAEAALTVYPPRDIPVRVVDAAGAPLAGVTIRQRLTNGYTDLSMGVNAPARTLWRDLGETDADGRLAARVAIRKDPFAEEEQRTWHSLFLIAEKDGCAISHSGWTDKPFFDGKEVARDGVTELKFTLREAAPRRGRIMISDDRGLGGLPVTVQTELRVDLLEGNGWRNEHMVHHVVTDAEGRFTLPAMQGTIEDVRVLLGGDELHAAVVPEAARRMAPYRPVALHRRKPKDGDELVVELQRLGRVELQLLDDTGGPANRADLIALSKAHSDVECDGWDPIAATDSAGRCALLLEPGTWMLFARSGDGSKMVHQELRVEPGQLDAVRLELRMTPMPAMRGRVVDGDGNPIAGANMDCHSMSWHSGPNRDPALDRIASTMNWSWIDSVTTDADGYFTCPFLLLDGMSYEGRFRVGKRNSDDFKIVPGEDPVTITVR